jgi:hypothetical protein
MFKPMEGEVAILYSSGVYKVADLFVRSGGELFAKYNSGFIRLYADGATSKAAVRIDTLQIDQELFKDKWAKLCVSSGKGRKTLDKDPYYIGSENESC